MGCNGTQRGNSEHIEEIYINASAIRPNEPINITCQFREFDNSGTPESASEYLWYSSDNGITWYTIYSNWSYFTEADANVGTSVNRSFVFNVNSTEGNHTVRCNINYKFNVSNYCNNSDSSYYDTDDINFTVVIPLSYDYWNITFANGTEISTGANLTRSDNVTVAAHWNKSISYAVVEINGTGIFNNYTATITNNWTNYTIILSNTTLYNQTNITINAIYANDSVGVWGFNKTSPSLFFYLQAGNSPNVTNFWFNYSGITTNKTNKYTNLTIYANVSDDVGLSRVIANITYPSNNSTLVNMTGESCYLPQWCIWNYTFGSDLHLNTTGNYTVRITATDIGNQNKSSGTDYAVENMSFYVNGTYSLNLSTNHSVYNRGENITIQVWDANDFSVYNLNWTVILTKGSLSPSTTAYNSTNYTYQIANDDPEGGYDLFTNISKSNNNGSKLWEFDVNKTLNLTISTDPSSYPAKNSLITASIALYNIRGELYTSSVNASIRCEDGDTVHPINFSSGYASYNLCHSPNAYSTSFNIIVNASDGYNNTGESQKTLTTETQTFGGGGGGGGSAAKVEVKNCTDGTQYNQCSSKRPVYCSNGTLIENCSICGCNPGYSCQSSGSCKVTALENFSFVLDIESVEIKRGEDGKVIVSLSNTGNTPLSLTTLTESECCNVSLEGIIDLKEKEDKDIQISIHVPLFISTGEYFLSIKIGKEYFKKEKAIKVIVTENPTYVSSNDMKIALNNLEAEISEYKKAGINVKDLENKIKESEMLLQNVNDSMTKDNLNQLENSVSSLEDNISSITSYLILLRTQKFVLENKFLITALAAMILITIYFVPEVFLPLYRFEKEVNKLKNDEKELVSSRVETEKQYFMRKIDENVFTKIMIEKQDKILKLRATINEREKDRGKILARTHPKEILKWFATGTKNLPKNVKNLFLKLYEKIKLYKPKKPLNILERKNK
jgi:hypothetical protein